MTITLAAHGMCADGTLYLSHAGISARILCTVCGADDAPSWDEIAEHTDGRTVSVRADGALIVHGS